MDFGMATAFAAPLYSPCTDPVRSVRLVRTKMLLRVRIVRANSKKSGQKQQKNGQMSQKGNKRKENDGFLPGITRNADKS